jgi:serine/threonine protein kinase
MLFMLKTEFSNHTFDLSEAKCLLQDSATAMVDVLHAVQYLHDIGLVHRDLKARQSPKIMCFLLLFQSKLRRRPNFVHLLN